MPRYYFDIYDDQFTISDDLGEELAGFEPAKTHAVGIATSVAKDIFPKGHSKVRVVVRHEAHPIFEAAVLLTTTTAGV